jgi:large subunit ribosomal protein L6
MSRLGKKPILIPEGVEAKLDNGTLIVKGPRGENRRQFKDDIVISVSEGKIILEPNKGTSALWGAYGSHIRNMIEGVISGFSKNLLIEGVGYRASKEGNGLVFSLGFSHPVKVAIPEGIDVKIEKNILAIFGTDKEKVGSFSAQIRALKPPEPYKGKGIRYEDEIIRRKAGKKAVATAI